MKKIALSLIVLLMLVGCSATSKETEKITVSHKLGEAEVVQNPKKVAVFDMGILDTLDTLGIEVHGVAKESLPKNLDKFKSDASFNIGSLFEPDFEGLSKEGFDLIIISGRTAKQYDELNKIAPTIYLGNDSSDEGLLASVKKNVETIKMIYPDVDGEKAITDLETKIDTLSKQVKSKDYATLFVMANGDEIKAFGPGSRYDHVFNEYGFRSVEHSFEKSRHGSLLSFELVKDLDPEVMIVMDRSAVTQEKGNAEELLDNDFIKQTNAYKNDRVVYVDPEIWYLTEGGLSALEVQVEELSILK
ncbi:siderophore ABC transporter substrate-binding protein [Erysipelothrix urinaevulpis]|uniref:siderophore ABC transporter substrate-binding protein n=1 Tax=Erysipelothrix urinaevulpis TaxID=2683717 RepID=UPI00135A3577|nr:ABC transporter substrate-binding protein [Erysipelothrix urinaevulpis]